MPKRCGPSATACAMRPKGRSWQRVVCLGTKLSQDVVRDAAGALGQQVLESRGEDRLSRIFPPLELSTLLDDPTINPALVLQRRDAQALWTWLVDRFRYLARDGDASAFYTDSASDYQQFASASPEPYALVASGGVVENLTASNPVVNDIANHVIRAEPKHQPRLALHIIRADDDWLQVTADLRVSWIHPPIHRQAPSGRWTCRCASS